MNMEQARQRLFAHLRQDIRDERVVGAMEQVRRELFVPLDSRHLAYDDIPLPIGEGQTISQPFIVALMTSALELQPRDKVLEIGTGSGYQAAILSLLAWEVVTVERIPSLADSARQTLQALGYTNVRVLLAGQVLGCPEEAPFDAITATAGAPRLPQELLDQMALGGRLVIPIGGRYEQDLVKVLRTQEGHSVRSLGPCRFVPLIGPGAWEDPPSPP